MFFKIKNGWNSRIWRNNDRKNMNAFFTQFPTSGDIFDKQEKKEKKKFEKAKTFKVRQIWWF